MSELKRLVLSGGLIIIAGATGLGAWGALAPLTGAVVAPAVVKVDLNRKVVQHQEGGIVRDIFVRDGDHVEAGQELIRLDDVSVDAQLDLLRTQRDAIRAKAARLEAERVYAAKVAFPRDLVKRERDPKIRELLAKESELFRTRREALDTQVAVLHRQIGETGAEEKALAVQLAAEERALKLQKDELAANQRLLEQGYVQKTRILTLQRAVAEYEASYGQHQAQASQARQRATELELRILSLRNQYAQNAADELKDTTARLFDLEERIRPSKDAAERQRITAPIAGVIVNLRVFTAGSVIGPRDVLMEIVPQVQNLIVEAHIRPEDINHVQKGSPAEIRLTAYKQRITPLVNGTVSYVSADRLSDAENHAAFYVVHVEVDRASLHDLTMQAGMPAEVYIRTDRRTVFDYLLAPVTQSLRRAMREPV
ncbi:MAG TPA: HlyD family type I secretion periplasmic adaptor subunit [Burkholderiales bacterium]|jgi:HlyD family type I secretion membrane fusion protein|nr:HlyD family type I secretion periplasmic adaptor subunit [Burkholderiales bacterium]